MSIKKTVNQGFKAADKTLKFIQTSFNTDIDFSDIIADLEYQATIIKDIQAERLINKVSDTEIIQRNNLLSEFENITNQFDLEGGNTTILKLTDELIYSLRRSERWLEEYNNWFNNNRTANIKDQLLAIGKAILGRAIELCPIKTGALRKSGTIIQTGDSVIVGFYCSYSIWVHECMDNYHQVGQAKFLETAVQEILPNTYTWVDFLDKGTVAVKITATY